ncbi:MAG: DUF302 domain-containing protein [Brevundimonas sp.]
MTYYYSKITSRPFEETVSRVRAALKAEGFGIITEIDVTATFREKLDIAFRPYIILGACNPKAAHEALSLEDKVGVMLPCNVIVQQLPSGTETEVAAIDPAASMSAIDNPALTAKAAEIGTSLRRALDSLG